MTKSSHEVTVYTRQGCHLCVVAIDLLRRHGASPKLVDIDQDARLKTDFDHCVPVVEIDGKVRFRGQVNEVLLMRILRR